MAKRIMSLLVVMTMMFSVISGVVFATELPSTGIDTPKYNEENPIPEAEAIIPDAAVAFKNALAAGGNVNLSQSVTVKNAHAETDLNIVTKDANINFGDHTFTLDGSGVKANPNFSALNILSGNVVINGGQGGIVNANTIEENNLIDCLYCIYVGSDNSSANVTITGGHYVAGCTAVHIRKGTVTITGGTFENLTPKWVDFILNCTDSYYKNGDAKFIVKGGTFIGYDPSNSSSENPKASFVAEGYKVVTSTDDKGRTVYTVVEDEAYNFKNDLAKGGNVSLLHNITVLDKNTMDDANKITTDTVVDFGTNVFTLDGDGKSDNFAGIRVQQGNTTLKGTTGGIRVASSTIGGTNVDGLYALLVGTTESAANVTITGGSYVGGYSAVSLTQGTVTIEGGYFEALCADKRYVINCYDSNYNNGSAKYIVKGGTFVEFDPANSSSENPKANFVAEGYKSVASTDSQGRTVYTVVCAHKSLAGYPLKEPTLVEDGCQPYYECNECHKLFMDAAAATEVANKADLVIPKLIKMEGTEVIVSDAAVMGAIQKSENSNVVELQVLTANTTVKEVTLPVASIGAVAAQDKGILIETSDVTITLDNKTLTTVFEEAGDANEITIEVKKENTKVLNNAQKEAVKDKDVEIVISAKILSNGKTISDFKGGKVTVEIPFKPAEGLKASDYRFIYIDNDGSITEIPSKYFDGIMVVELGHFSEYAIVRDLDATGGVGTVPGDVDSTEPAPAPAPAAPVKDNTPKTGAISIIGLVSAMAVGGLVLTRKRK